MDTSEQENVSKYIFYPQSNIRIYWDIVMIIFVIYNIIVLPMSIGLGLEVGALRHLFEIFIDLFFACDIVMNFFTGFIDENNQLIMD